MTTPELEHETLNLDSTEEKEERRRRWLLLLLLLLLLLCCCVGYFMLRYLMNPQPLPDMLPEQIQVLNYPPAYRFSISGVDQPMGVALSLDGQKIYVAEGGGERLVKVFDRQGTLLNSFAPAGTSASTRQPRYIAVDPNGRIFLVERLNNVIHIFDENGNYLDAILAQDMTLSKFLNQEIEGGLLPDTTFSYEGVNRIVHYELPDQTKNAMVLPKSDKPWAPLSIRFDAQGNLMYTDISAGLHSINIIPAADLNGSLSNYAPNITMFGVQGKEPGQLDFPNSVVVDSRGNFYVSDGNNGRIASWDTQSQYRTFFGFGSNEDSLNLPRGMWIDRKDRLHVADAVGAVVRVYDVSGEEPVYLYSFGAFGIADGQFNFPNDIVMDGTGRLYVADRENNRIQVWSY